MQLVTVRRAQPGVGADRGSASLWLLAVGLVLILAGVAAAAVGAVRVARHAAWAAADLSAMAGAARALDGEDAACARSAEIAADNGGRLVACTADGLDVVVMVELTVSPLPGLSLAVPARARAGPVRG